LLKEQAKRKEEKSKAPLVVSYCFFSFKKYLIKVEDYQIQIGN